VRDTLSQTSSFAQRAKESGLPAGVPLIGLNDGNSIPQLGFGVWQIPDDAVGAAIAEAIASGYRSIDTAQGYDNEAGVGRAIREAEIDREDLFVTSKIRTRSMGADTRKGIEESL
jgi:2,5-diketo-D-gluconate reductase A